MSTALGCLAHAALVGLLTMAIDGFTGQAVPPVLRPWAALVAAALLVLGASNLWHLLRGYGRGDASRDVLLARARTGEPPSGGGPMVVTGVARCDGPPLRAPLTGTECIAYQYRMYRKLRTDAEQGTRTEPIWWGMACRPFVVDAGRRAVRVAAMPQIIDAPVTHVAETGRSGNGPYRGTGPYRSTGPHQGTGPAGDVIASARAYVRETRFADGSGLDLVSSAATMFTELLAEQRQGIRHDWHRHDGSVDPGDLLLEESVIAQDAEVSVAGYWSPERQALLPEGGLGGAPVTITTGSAAHLIRHATAVPHSASSVGIFGVVALLLGAALVWVSAQGYLSSW